MWEKQTGNSSFAGTASGMRELGIEWQSRHKLGFTGTLGPKRLSSDPSDRNSAGVFSSFCRAFVACLLATVFVADAAEFKPIEISKQATTERDFQKAQRAWAERALVVPFQGRAKGQPWA